MKKKMTPAERVITAFNLGIPDEIPTFELQFHLAQQMYGLSFEPENLMEIPTLPLKEIEKKAYDLADIYTRVFGDQTAYDIGGAAISGNPELDSKPGLDYAIIPATCPWWDDVSSPFRNAFYRHLRENIGNTRMLEYPGDGTFALPDGEEMFDFAYRMVDDPQSLHDEAERMCTQAIEFNKIMRENGQDVAWLGSDYCYNSGPFLSPKHFDEFITPYLIRICEAAKKEGLYVIKHTDGNIMPILNSLLAAHPHAIHSLDPMAGVDIREVKRLVGDKVCLCGNVNCALISTGTDEQIRESAEYCLKYGGQGGGYIYTTSNVPFYGMPADKYQLVLDIWHEKRKYE